MEIKLETDSREYDVLFHAAIHSLAAPGASVEIGVRRGGGSEIIMRSVQVAQPGAIGRRVHIGIDPWGDLPYILDGKDSGYRYSDHMRQTASVGLYQLGLELDSDVLIFAMTDSDYFRLFAEGVPFYRDGKAQPITEYSLVHFDGPHNVEDVAREMAFFGPRMSMGSWWVFDDVYLYDHASIEDDIFSYGFVPNDAPFSPARMDRVKASYRKEQ